MTHKGITFIKFAEWEFDMPPSAGPVIHILTRGLPAAAVAQSCGASVAMIEKTYAIFTPGATAGLLA